MSEPVVDETPNALPVLRREAILPRERRGGLGAVALLCSLAGVASGFALATTILATQIAQSEARARGRGYAGGDLRIGPSLGVIYTEAPDGSALITGVKQGSPAAASGLRPDDRITRLDGEILDRPHELGGLVRATGVGREVTLEVRRGDRYFVTHPTLVSGLISDP